MGDDPLTENQNSRSFNITTSSESGMLSGHFIFSFQGEEVDFDASGKNFNELNCKSRLESLPNLEKVECKRGPLDANHGGSTWTISILDFPLSAYMNNIYFHDGNPPLSDFSCVPRHESFPSAVVGPLCSMADVSTENLKEYLPCSNHGTCDGLTGKCICAAGFNGIRCDDNLDTAPKLEGLADSPYFTGAVLALGSNRALTDKYKFISVKGMSQEVLSLAGDGKLALHHGDMEIKNGGLALSGQGNLRVANGALEMNSGPIRAQDSGGSEIWAATSSGLTPPTTAGSRGGAVLTVGALEHFGSNDGGVDLSILRVQGPNSAQAVAVKLKEAGELDGTKIPKLLTLAVAAPADGDGDAATRGAAISVFDVAADGGTTVHAGGLSVEQGGLLIEQDGVVVGGGVDVANGGLTVGSGGIDVKGPPAEGGLSMRVETGGLGIADGWLKVVASTAAGKSAAAGGRAGSVVAAFAAEHGAAGGDSTVLELSMDAQQQDKQRYLLRTVAGDTTIVTIGDGGAGAAEANADGSFSADKIKAGLAGLHVHNGGLAVSAGGLSVVGGQQIVSGGLQVDGGIRLKSGGLTIESDGFAVNDGGFSATTTAAAGSALRAEIRADAYVGTALAISIDDKAASNNAAGLGAGRGAEGLSVMEAEVGGKTVVKVDGRGQIRTIGGLTVLAPNEDGSPSESTSDETGGSAAGAGPGGIDVGGKLRVGGGMVLQETKIQAGATISVGTGVSYLRVTDDGDGNSANKVATATAGRTGGPSEGQLLVVANDDAQDMTGELEVPAHSMAIFVRSGGGWKPLTATLFDSSRVRSVQELSAANDLDIGPHTLRAHGLQADGQKEGGLCVYGADGQLQGHANMTMSADGTLQVSQMGSFTAMGPIDFNAQSVDNVHIIGGSISGMKEIHTESLTIKVQHTLSLSHTYPLSYTLARTLARTLSHAYPLPYTRTRSYTLS
jgi:hypothetical protein